jgi:YaiO family outer membrane protein
LQFGDGVNIYIGSLSKYLGNWLLIGQVFVTPKAVGTSQSYHGAVRKYFGDREYVGVRYRHGAWNEEARQVQDILVLDSDGVSAELVKRLGSRLELTLRGGWAREDRPLREGIQQYSGAAQLYVRF